MLHEKNYNKEFYDNQEAGLLRSAKIVLPIVLKIIKPKSIVDSGCGVGPWLKVAKAQGCIDCLGIEGEWVLQKIKKPPFYLKIKDLKKKVILNKKYDLAISLEVAEHLKPSRADSFVKDLCRSSFAVLFSAARPNQEGTNHLNEQLASYWVKKFHKAGYNGLDCIRPLIKDNFEVEHWYRTNTLLFVSDEIIKKVTLSLLKSNLSYFDCFSHTSLRSACKELSKLCSITLKYLVLKAQKIVRKTKKGFFLQ